MSPRTRRADSNRASPTSEGNVIHKNSHLMSLALLRPYPPSRSCRVTSIPGEGNLLVQRPCTLHILVVASGQAPTIYFFLETCHWRARLSRRAKAIEYTIELDRLNPPRPHSPSAFRLYTVRTLKYMRNPRPYCTSSSTHLPNSTFVGKRLWGSPTSRYVPSTPIAMLDADAPCEIWYITQVLATEWLLIGLMTALSTKGCFDNRLSCGRTLPRMYNYTGMYIGQLS
ncbi:hypothetical protein F5B21DRAFT_240390 [Xylaria acuta]|nr:hypothetical protein F5B21DRAFT_240390 [Xylaria acuta]